MSFSAICYMSHDAVRSKRAKMTMQNYKKNNIKKNRWCQNHLDIQGIGQLLPGQPQNFQKPDGLQDTERNSTVSANWHRATNYERG